LRKIGENGFPLGVNLIYTDERNKLDLAHGTPGQRAHSAVPSRLGTAFGDKDAVAAIAPREESHA
jgi:hypothetical protein